MNSRLITSLGVAQNSNDAVSKAVMDSTIANTKLNGLSNPDGSVNLNN